VSEYTRSCSRGGAATTAVATLAATVVLPNDHSFRSVLSSIYLADYDKERKRRTRHNHVLRVKHKWLTSCLSTFTPRYITVNQATNFYIIKHITQKTLERHETRNSSRSRDFQRKQDGDKKTGLTLLVHSRIFLGLIKKMCTQLEFSVINE